MSGASLRSPIGFKMLLCAVAPLLVVPMLGYAAEPDALPTEPTSWTQWGGPSGDFRAPVAGPVEAWRESGPTTLWRRPIGDGYSAVLAEQQVLYTMARYRGEEAVLALDAQSGATLWEHRYMPPRYEGVTSYGVGPRSTPLIVGKRLFTVGITGSLRALDKATGQLIWKRELWGSDFLGNRLEHGYSSSPMAFEGGVVLPVGGDSASLVAFDQRTGDVIWQSQSFRNSYSSPQLVELAGKTQFVLFMAEELIGLEARSGELLWRYPHANQWSHNISPPVIAEGNQLFLSSPLAGARGLEIVPSSDGRSQVNEIWSTRRVQLYHGSAVQQGDWILGSSGVTSPAFMTLINWRTGEIAWRRRGFAKANCIAVGGPGAGLGRRRSPSFGDSYAGRACGSR